MTVDCPSQVKVKVNTKVKVSEKLVESLDGGWGLSNERTSGLGAVWYKPYYQSRCGLKKPGCQSEAEGRGLAAWFFKTTSRLVVRFNILSDITGRTPELKCRFENHWQARLLRPGGPKV